MKKQITHPDGKVEVVEGTAEELAEYERKLQEQGSPKKGGKKRVLLNEDELRAMIAEELKKVPQNHYHFTSCGCQCHQPAILPSPIWIGPVNPEPLPWYTITSTSKIEIPNADVPATSGFIQTNEMQAGLNGNFLVQN